MSSIGSWSFLRRVLLVDAVSSGAMGVGLLLFSGVLEALLALPRTLLTETGIVLLPFAAFVGYIAVRDRPWRAGVWIVIAINTLWAIDSIVLLFTGWIAPNALGIAFIAAQAAVVATLAELEYVGVRPLAAA
jgi:hypothetical protein